MTLPLGRSILVRQHIVTRHDARRNNPPPEEILKNKRNGGKRDAKSKELQKMKRSISTLPYSLKPTRRLGPDNIAGSSCG